MSTFEFSQLIVAGANYGIAAVIISTGVFGVAVFLYQAGIDLRRRARLTKNDFSTVLDE